MEHASELICLGAIYVDRQRAIAQGEKQVWVKKGAYQVDWKRRVVSESEDFVIVNKPGGVPVHASLDNRLETVCSCVARVLGCCELTAMHRWQLRPP
eukprot:192908-Hanusia_phi.AAC.1